MRPLAPGRPHASGHHLMFLQVSAAEDRRFELLRGCPQHAFQQCWPAFTGVRHRPANCANTVWVNIGERWRTWVNETTNETAAGAGELTPASPARVLLLRLTHGEPARQSRPHPLESVGDNQATSTDGITLSDREVRGERAHSRLMARVGLRVWPFGKHPQQADLCRPGGSPLPVP